jgi:hypothetical protein
MSDAIVTAFVHVHILWTSRNGMFFFSGWNTKFFFYLKIAVFHRDLCNNKCYTTKCRLYVDMRLCNSLFDDYAFLSSDAISHPYVLDYITR